MSSGWVCRSNQKEANILFPLDPPIIIIIPLSLLCPYDPPIIRIIPLPAISA
jgi:hypothetical protein